MSHKLYRICLLSVVIIAIVGGIFYYLNYVRDESDITEGTLVRRHGMPVSEIVSEHETTSEGEKLLKLQWELEEVIG